LLFGSPAEKPEGGDPALPVDDVPVPVPPVENGKTESL
jgi:hypothetical protein